MLQTENTPIYVHKSVVQVHGPIQQNSIGIFWCSVSTILAGVVVSERLLKVAQKNTIKIETFLRQDKRSMFEYHRETILKQKGKCHPRPYTYVQNPIHIGAMDCTSGQGGKGRGVVKCQHRLGTGFCLSDLFPSFVHWLWAFLLPNLAHPSTNHQIIVLTNPVGITPAWCWMCRTPFQNGGTPSVQSFKRLATAESKSFNVDYFPLPLWKLHDMSRHVRHIFWNGHPLHLTQK